MKLVLCQDLRVREVGAINRWTLVELDDGFVGDDAAAIATAMPELPTQAVAYVVDLTKQQGYEPKLTLEAQPKPATTRRRAKK